MSVAEKKTQALVQEMWVCAGGIKVKVRSSLEDQASLLKVWTCLWSDCSQGKSSEWNGNLNKKKGRYIVHLLLFEIGRSVWQMDATLTAATRLQGQFLAFGWWISTSVHYVCHVPCRPQKLTGYCGHVWRQLRTSISSAISPVVSPQPHSSNVVDSESVITILRITRAFKIGVQFLRRFLLLEAISDLTYHVIKSTATTRFNIFDVQVVIVLQMAPGRQAWSSGCMSTMHAFYLKKWPRG